MDMQLSKYFTLNNLSTTNTGLDNLPNDEQISNLQELAQLLDQIYDQIGPFKINSAFRSAEVNAQIGGASGSLHMQGKAGDMAPLTMTPDDFFAKLAASPLRNSTGEIINESERGVVHVSTPTFSMTGVLKYLQNGEYFRYAQDEINAIIGSVSSAVKENPISSLLIFSGVLLITLYFLSRRRR
jgi:hypothetical protein